MNSLSQLIAHKDNLLNKKDDINEKLIDFYKENYNAFEGRNTNPSALEAREGKFEEFFKWFL
jgi:hypothetical protein